MRQWLRSLPLSILLPCLLLPLFGLSGMLRADELYGVSIRFERQLIWLMIAWPVMLAITTVDYRNLKPWVPALYLVSIALLLVVLFMPAVNGSRRWIPLGFFDFQPSEFARLALILSLAHYLMFRATQRTISGLFPPLVMTTVPLLLIFKEPDLGTAALFLPVLYTMLFAAGARMRHLLAALLIGIALLPALWVQMSPEQRSRVTTVFNQTSGGPTPRGDGYHLHQSKQVIALGGFSGSHGADELPAHPADYALPAARTDFILVLIAEEWGFAGVSLLLGLYAWLTFCGLQVAGRSRDPFGRLLATGIVTMFATQMLINAGMTVGLVPITGITLPLCSYGGSSLVSTSAALGLLMNIAMRPGYDVGGRPVWQENASSVGSTSG